MGPEKDNGLKHPGHSQAHGAAPQGARLPLQGGADDEVREQEEGPVLLATNCLLWGPRQDSGPEALPAAYHAQVGQPGQEGRALQMPRGKLGLDPGLLLGWNSRRPEGSSCEQRR